MNIYYLAGLLTEYMCKRRLLPRFWKPFLAIAILVWFNACKSLGPNTLFRSSSPHEQYERSLKDAKLDQTALGADWLAAADRALRDSVRISVPYRETGYFSASKPFAVGYRLNSKRGDRFFIQVDIQGMKNAQVFIDVFDLSGRDPDRIISAKADTNRLVWETRRSGPHLIRIQPELLRGGSYTISITREPVLSFPVQGRDSRSISSYFGAPRDGGRRTHEGVDIFAPRGTPLVASVDGIISGVGANRLGGNVVWLSDLKRNLRLYYAHLDKQLVREGQQVSVGDTIGTVGNTGNARNTAPHLHFGVYQFSEGAVDPLPFVRLGSGPARQPLLAESRLGDSARVSVTRAIVRQSPKPDAPALLELPRSFAFTILGGTAEWLRIELPGDLTGYVSSTVIEPVDKPLRRLPIAAPTNLLEAATPQAAIVETLPGGTAVEVLGVVDDYQLVRSQNGQTGWVMRAGQ
ncbi:hypothetical protein GCM10023187_11870 [Nibrella viscosa]|uniref:SH3 domain-containing protein n=1 Tax=Nibrella viscosa TaxID=1084524 RepID=A0ABP8K2I9_9BACT